MWVRGTTPSEVSMPPKKTDIPALVDRFRASVRTHLEETLKDPKPLARRIVEIAAEEHLLRLLGLERDNWGRGGFKWASITGSVELPLRLALQEKVKTQAACLAETIGAAAVTLKPSELKDLRKRYEELYREALEKALYVRASELAAQHASANAMALLGLDRMKEAFDFTPENVG